MRSNELDFVEYRFSDCETKEKSRSLTSFKHRYTRLDLSNRVWWALYKVFKRTRLCRVYKSNIVWYTKLSAFEQALTSVDSIYTYVSECVIFPFYVPGNVFHFSYQKCMW